MTTQSIANKVVMRIRGTGRGYVFSSFDFVDLGNRRAVDQALSRLARKGMIRRLGRGLYDYPRVSTRLGVLIPSSPAVAKAIARKTGLRIETSGAQAANALGLSTQVPAQVVYDTDGPARTIKLDRQTIRFRHASPRKLAMNETAASAVLRAIEYLGKGGVTRQDIAHLAEILIPKDKKRLRQLGKRAPAWTHRIIDEILSNRSPDHD